MQAAPFPAMRCPWNLSPAIYAGFIVWTLCGANPLMLVLAYSFDKRPKVDSQSAAIALGTTSALCALGISCTFASMERRFRSTFYKHRNCAKHVRDWCWDLATFSTDLNGQVKEYDRETIRAYHAMSFTKASWPMDLVEPFVRDNWCVSAHVRSCYF